MVALITLIGKIILFVFLLLIIGAVVITISLFVTVLYIEFIQNNTKLQYPWNLIYYAIGLLLLVGMYILIFRISWFKLIAILF